MAGMPKKQDGPLEVGTLYGGDFTNQQRVGVTVGNPATGAGSGGPVYSAWGDDDAHIAEMQRQHNAYLRSQDARGFAVTPAATPATIASAAGFPLAGATVPAYAPPKAPLNAGLVARPRPPDPPPMTRTLPDWVHNVFADAMGVERLPPTPTAPWITALGNMIPGRGAVAATPSTSPPDARSKINGATPAGMPTAPPLAPWYERMGLVPSSTPPPIARDGVRG